MTVTLNAERARIFRITHIENMPWVLKNGLHCKNAARFDPNFVQIGNPELIERRRMREVPVPPGGSLSDYIPFYFTPFSMMMFNIKTGYGGIKQVLNSNIVILVSSLNSLKLGGLPTVFTDRHAYLRTAKFFSSLEDLANIDWELLQNRDFRRDPEDPEKTDRYQAEALVYRNLSVENLTGIVCYSSTEKKLLEQQIEVNGLGLQIASRPGWYF